MLLQMEQRRRCFLISRMACGEALGVFAGGAQHVEREPLRGLGADAGQLAQLFDQARHRLRETCTASERH